MPHGQQSHHQEYISRWIWSFSYWLVSIWLLPSTDYASNILYTLNIYAWCIAHSSVCSSECLDWKQMWNQIYAALSLCDGASAWKRCLYRSCMQDIIREYIDRGDILDQDFEIYFLSKCDILLSFAYQTPVSVMLICVLSVHITNELTPRSICD